MIFDSDFLIFYEQLDKLTEESNSYKATASEDNSSTEKEYIDLIYSIKDRADFIEKAQALYDNLPVNMGFRVSYPGGVKRFRKQADGSVELTGSHQTEIIASTEAVATLQAIASIPNAKIYTFAHYPQPDAHYGRGEMGTRIINQDGSFNYPVHNYIVPRLISKT